MTDYDKLVKDLHDIEKTMFALGTSPINMDNVSIRLAYDKEWGQTAKDASSAIEDLLSFAHYIANKVTMSDEDWEDYHEAFTEVACRKLVKLGVISIEDGMYVYRQDEPRQEVQE